MDIDFIEQLRNEALVYLKKLFDDGKIDFDKTRDIALKIEEMRSCDSPEKLLEIIKSLDDGDKQMNQIVLKFIGKWVEKYGSAKQ